MSTNPTQPGDPVTGADLVVSCLAAEGISHVFGVPGTTVMDLIDSIARQDAVQYLSTRHEQVAGFMADGFSRGGRSLGACLASRGPGAANLAIAVHNAYDESIPILVLIGQVPGTISHRRSFEEMDVVATFTSMTKWVVEINDVRRIPELLQRAVRTAVTGRPGPVLVSLPMDVLQAQTTAAADPTWRSHPPAPDPHGVAQAAALLTSARRPILVMGGGTTGADTAAFVALAERLSLPVLTTWMRQSAFPNDHPAFLGALGYGMHAVSEELVAEADVVLAVGCRFSEFTTKRWTLFSPTSALIHIDIDPVELGKIQRPTIGLASDATLAVRALLAALPQADPTEVATERASRLTAARARLVEATELDSAELAADRPAGRVSSIEIVRAVQDLAGRPDILLVQDAPSFGPWSQRHLVLRRTNSFFAAAGGAMGWGLPAAMGLSVARPEQRVVTLCGDGSFWMVAQDFETCVREGIPVVNVVVNNFAYGNTRDRQRTAHEGRYSGVFYGNPDFADYARLLGGFGVRVERGDQFAAALESALAQDLPAIIDVIQDPMYGLPPGLTPPAAR